MAKEQFETDEPVAVLFVPTQLWLIAHMLHFMRHVTPVLKPEIEKLSQTILDAIKDQPEDRDFGIRLSPKQKAMLDAMEDCAFGGVIGFIVEDLFERMEKGDAIIGVRTAEERQGADILFGDHRNPPEEKEILH